MGLHTSHNCWSGPYGAFHNWRVAVAHAANYPPLELMEGFFRDDEVLVLFGGESSYLAKSLMTRLPIPWEHFSHDPLHLLLQHSDCDGELRWQDCELIADRLQQILPHIADGTDPAYNNRDRTEQFIAGLMQAYEKRENVEFS